MRKSEIVNTKGVILSFNPDHHRADKDGYVRKHILIAEEALGKLLPLKAVVHHHTPQQLVVCQNDTYHKLLHQRQRAYKACGYASWRKCKICKKYDSPDNLYINGKHRHVFHRNCAAEYCYNRKHKFVQNAS